MGRLSHIVPTVPQRLRRRFLECRRALRLLEAAMELSQERRNEEQVPRDECHDALARLDFSQKVRYGRHCAFASIESPDRVIVAPPECKPAVLELHAGVA
jgi:hypothetical protein